MDCFRSRTGINVPYGVVTVGCLSRSQIAGAGSPGSRSIALFSGEGRRMMLAAAEIAAESRRMRGRNPKATFSSSMRTRGIGAKAILLIPSANADVFI